MTDVNEHLIGILEDFYGEMKYLKGANSKRILAEWERNFGKYEPEVLHAAVRKYIATDAYGRFPTIAKIKECISGDDVKEKEGIECHQDVMKDYFNFGYWYNTLMGRGRKSQYPSVINLERHNTIYEHVKIFAKMNPEIIHKYDSRWRTICGLAYREGWLDQCEKRIQEADSANKEKTVHCKKYKTTHSRGRTMPLGAICAELCLMNAPKEIFDAITTK